jgi:hypothetical protein
MHSQLLVSHKVKKAQRGDLRADIDAARKPSNKLVKKRKTPPSGTNLCITAVYFLHIPIDVLSHLLALCPNT